MSKKDEIRIRWNWKIFWMVLAIVFFFLWILNVLSNVYETQQFEDLKVDCNNSLNSLEESLQKDCNQAIKDLSVSCDQDISNLHTQWQNAYTTLKNCYQNGLTTCNTNLPSLTKRN